MMILSFDRAAEQQSGSNELAEMRTCMHRYSSFVIADVRDWIPVTSIADGIDKSECSAQCHVNNIIWKKRRFVFKGFQKDLGGIYFLTVSQFWHHSAATFWKEKT